jgi:transcriptional regulator with XRE-family HTH domain
MFADISAACACNQLGKGRTIVAAMSEKNTERPYKDLGNKLKSLRVRLQESIADVSGAVEINADLLLRIEAGFVKPTEDILLLLMTHLDVQEEDASKLWKLAGYSTDNFESRSNPDAAANQPQVFMVVSQDTRVQYTDMVNVTVNDYGVVLNFMQKAGPGQPQLISRFGMSKDHARSMIHVLQTTLDQAEQPAKQLGQKNTTDESSQH